jgi:four helix bundle protein
MDDTRHKTDELTDRLIDFGVRVIKIVDALPSTAAGKHIAGQLMRSGTSPAANYAEGSVAESRADFVHKLRIVLKELRESLVWLRMIIRADLLKQKQLTDIIDECEQLARIINASITTAKNNAPSRSSNKQ